jgi:hypothetical protein
MKYSAISHHFLLIGVHMRVFLSMRPLFFISQKLGFQQRELELEDAFQERLRIRELELDEQHRQDLLHMKAKWDQIQIEALEFQENTLSAALKRQIRVVRQHSPCPVISNNRVSNANSLCALLRVFSSTRASRSKSGNWKRISPPTSRSARWHSKPNTRRRRNWFV